MFLKRTEISDLALRCNWVLVGAFQKMNKKCSIVCVLFYNTLLNPLGLHESQKGFKTSGPNQNRGRHG